MITKQAIKYTERIIDSAKRIPAVANFKQAFELAISKMKRPDRLERTDFIQGELTPQITTEIEAIKMKNEEIADAELWSTESLCFTYFNILIQYRTTKQVSSACRFYFIFSPLKSNVFYSLLNSCLEFDRMAPIDPRWAC